MSDLEGDAGKPRRADTNSSKKSHQRDREPGFIRPTRNQAQQDPDEFYRLIAYLQSRRNKKLQVNHVADALGCSPGNASRRLRAKNLGDDERDLVLSEIYSRRLIFGSWIEQVREVPHNLFYSMMDFFDIHENSQDNAHGAILGTYKLWRYSADLEGEYVLGRVDIEEDHNDLDDDSDQDATALRVKIKQTRKANQLQRGTDEIVDGYFFRISNMYTMLVRQELTHNFRSTIFKDFRMDYVGTNINKNSIYRANTEHLVTLDGFAMGMDANLLFFSPVHVELVDDKEELERLDDMLDIIPESKVPSRILQKLKRYPRIVR